MLTETAARWLLVLHTALGAAAVASSTHLVVWIRRHLRGDFARHRAVRNFAVISFALMLGAFGAGNVMYPTYKVEVRVAYLESGAAVAADQAARADALAHVAAREGAEPRQATPTAELVAGAAKAGRWFDVKEHWIALGLLVAGALVLVLGVWDPRRDTPAIAPIVVALAVIAAATTWLGAIIGVLTAAWRAV